MTEKDPPVVDPDNVDRLKQDLLDALWELLTGYSVDPYEAIPLSMRGDYPQNCVRPDQIVTDYSSMVRVSSIPSGGMGEQWHMVQDNLEQSALFFSALNVVDELSSLSVATFQTFFDQNPAATAVHTFEQGIYSVTIHYDEDMIGYVLDYTATFPYVGEQKAQISLVMDRDTREKAVRIQLGNPNALAYTVSENGYEFAIKYLGVRRAYFRIAEDDDGNYVGHINEFLVVEGVEIQSASDFYVTEDYVIVVGNKADDMVAFDGRICELYRVSDGCLVAYEVKETLLGIEYDTLWFDLEAMAGINSIRYRAKTNDTSAAFFVNGSSAPWEVKTGSFLDLSRRFDIEFRTRYYNTYDPATGEYKTVKAEVPMLFVQEKFMESLTEDIHSENGITVTNRTNVYELALLMEMYDFSIPVFDENKDSVTPELIVMLIGNPVVFA